MDEYLTHRPGGALGAVVPRFAAYRSDGLTPGTHAGLPSATLTLVLPLDDGLDVTLCGVRGRYGAMLSGLHTSPAVIRYGERQAGIQLAIDPLACRALFGLPAAELVDAALDLDAVWGAVAERLLDAAASQNSLAAACRALEHQLPTPRDVGVRREVAAAWRLILASRGQARLDDVADAVGWSRRHLGAQFRREFGITPKQASRLRRFEHSVALMRAHHDLAEAAALAGFADQSHFTREWRTLGGSSPARWLREEPFAFIQDNARALVESGSHD